ncbi:MAG: metallophosphoesterase [Geminicoccaceae bacterium]
MPDPLLTLAGLGAAAAAWGFAIEPRLLRLRRVAVRSPQWPAGWPALRIGVLSDLHASRPHVTRPRIAALVARLLAERPDLVLLPGDFVCTRTPGQRPLPMREVAEALAPLAATRVVATLGNHDHEHGAREVMAELGRAGIEVLYNAATTVDVAGGTLQLAGIPCDAWSRFDSQRALRRTDPSRPLLVLSHMPDPFPLLPAQAQLTVAGHTHGGQVAIPGLPPPVTCSRLPRRQARGLHRSGDRFLYVSAGIGMSGLPVRFGVPPEIAVLTLSGGP